VPFTPFFRCPTADLTCRKDSLEEASARLTRTLVGYAFHYPDEPRSLVDEDVEGYPLRPDGHVPARASASVPPAAVSMLTPGIVTDEAAMIDVPVLIVAGEIDVNTDFDAERATYRNAPSVDTMRLPRAAHMHNFASSRERLWRHLHDLGEARATVLRGRTIPSSRPPF
jgi:pimeloyl-ACP methyl ester carboxylesterase